MLVTFPTVIPRSARPARVLRFATRLVCAGLFAICSVAALPAQEVRPLQAPKGLTLCFVNVQWGDATIVVGPTGRCLVFDGGPNGMGTRAVVPWLRKLGVKRVDHAIASHYHGDHIGGLDEVISGIPTTNVWDRGTRNTKGYAGSYASYVRIAGTRRKTIKVGQVFDLGGGATAKCYATDGWVLGTSTRHRIESSSNYENSASIVLKIEYGDFSCWLGGDLTGGGGRYDMETPVSKVFGDCDVYLANHHGWSDGSNANLMRNLDPEVCVISCSHKNTHNVPHRATLDRMTTPARSRLVIGTTAGAGEIGFTVGGTTLITSDGWRYRVTSQKGHSLDLYTDEFRGHAPQAGQLVISEFHRRPKQYWGEYIEVANVSGQPLNLRGTELSTKSGRVTLFSPYRLLPGGKLIVAAHGDPSRNGALPFPHSIPGRAYLLHDTSDELRLRHSFKTLDVVRYSSGFAGGLARAAERVDLYGSPSASNFKSATTRYGPADYGTPSRLNGHDRTKFVPQVGVEVLPQSTSGGGALHFFLVGRDHPSSITCLGLSFATTPGIRVGSVLIPLRRDPLFNLVDARPGFVQVLPKTGVAALRIPIPKALRLTGLRAYAATWRLDFTKPPFVAAASRSLEFRFP